jgi:hydroxylamine reductase (hybrid-cluster protein)
MDSSSTTSTRQSVTFRQDESLHKIQEFQPIEEFERPLIWWSMSDFARFKSSCYKDVKALRSTPDENDGVNQQGDTNEHQQDSSFYCLRGLEGWGGKETRARREHIQQATQVVISSQNFSDAFVCADVYRAASLQARIQAQVRGAQDEKAVLWERTQEELLQDKDDADVAIGQDTAKNSRIKRRRSSARKSIGSKSSSIGISLKNFARKITLPSAA